LYISSHIAVTMALWAYLIKINPYIHNFYDNLFYFLNYNTFDSSWPDDLVEKDASKTIQNDSRKNKSFGKWVSSWGNLCQSLLTLTEDTPDNQLLLITIMNPTQYTQIMYQYCTRNFLWKLRTFNGQVHLLRFDKIWLKLRPPLDHSEDTTRLIKKFW
jgi:hypothetical protein